MEQIRPQLDDPNQVKEILSMMEEVLAGTADYDQRYPSMQKAHQDLTDYQDGIFSLFTPISSRKRKHAGSPGACSGAEPGGSSGRTSQCVLPGI